MHLLSDTGHPSHGTHDASQKSTNWFTEGFDTADLKDAKALLVELA